MIAKAAPASQIGMVFKLKNSSRAVLCNRPSFATTNLLWTVRNLTILYCNLGGKACSQIQFNIISHNQTLCNTAQKQQNLSIHLQESCIPRGHTTARSKSDTTSNFRLNPCLLATIAPSTPCSDILHLPLATHSRLLKLVPVLDPGVFAGLASVRCEPSVLLDVCCDGSGPIHGGVRHGREGVCWGVLALLCLLLVRCSSLSFLVKLVILSYPFSGLILIITVKCTFPTCIRCTCQSVATPRAPCCITAVEAV